MDIVPVQFIAEIGDMHHHCIFRTEEFFMPYRFINLRHGQHLPLVPAHTLQVEDLTVDMESRQVWVSGREVRLTRKEYDILHYFMSRPNHTVDKTALAEGVWGDHIDQADNFDFVYAQMKNLRRKLHDAGDDIEIRAVYGFGYKLVQP